MSPTVRSKLKNLRATSLHQVNHMQWEIMLSILPSVSPLKKLYVVLDSWCTCL